MSINDNRDRGPDCSWDSPTQPGMRVRTGRFNFSRSESFAISHRDSLAPFLTAIYTLPDLMAKQQQLLSFKRLNLAGLAFDRAAALAEYMIAIAPNPLGLLYSPLAAGLVVTYMRPFMRADGLGPLPADFAQFTDTTFQKSHDQLKESRNTLYAHTDMVVAPKLTTDDGSVPFDMWIEFDGSNRYTLMPGIPEIAPTTLPDIVRVCQFQRSRVTTQIMDSWAALTGCKVNHAGRYTVGTTFP